MIAAGLAGVEAELTLPEPVAGDPAAMDAVQRATASIHRLPTSATEAADALEGSTVLETALGKELHDVILTVRRHEADRCAELNPQELAAATRWRW